MTLAIPPQPSAKTKPRRKILDSRVAAAFKSWKYPLLTVYYFILSSTVAPRPASAAIFDGFQTFSKNLFSGLFNAIGLGGLTTFTDAIALFVTGIVVFIVGGWIAWQAYKAVQEYDRQEFEGMIRHIIGAVMATIVLFSTDFILDKVTT